MRRSKFNVKQIPNILSVFRIFLIPIYILLFFDVIHMFSLPPMVASGIVFLLAGFTDALDGFLARRNQWITDIGKLLDPLADKLLEVVVSVCLAVKFGGPFTILSTIIIFKESVMILGAYFIMSKSKVYVSALWCGKIATLVWFFLLFFVHFFQSADSSVFSYALCITLILFMILAFVVYAFNYATQIQSTKEVMLENKKNKKNK